MTQNSIGGMKDSSKVFWFWLSALAILASGQPRADEISLILDDSKLHGRVLEFDQSTLAFGYESSHEVLKFKRAGVRSLGFGSTEQIAQSGFTLKLVGGDSLSGELIGFANDVFVFESPVFGRLEIAREHVASLYLNGSTGGRLYQGPGGPEGWQSDELADWEFDLAKNSVTNQSSTASLGRNLGLPEGYRLGFTVEWEDKPKFEINFGCDELSYNPEEDFYKLRVNNSGVQLLRRSQGRNYSAPLNSEGSFNAEDINPFKKLNFVVEVSAEKTLKIFINGMPAGVYQDLEAGRPTGGGIFIRANTSKQTFSNIQVVTSLSSVDIERPDNLEADQLVSRDGNLFSGRLESIDFNRPEPTLSMEVRVAKKSQVIHPPMNQLGAIHLANQIKLAAEATTVDFGNEENVRGEAILLDEGQLTLEHANLGRIKIPRRLISRIRFFESEKSELFD